MRLKKILLRVASILLLVILLAAGFLFLAMVQPQVFLPHAHIVIAAPFSADNPPTALIPMGETIYHPNAPGGHPGIDFSWPPSRIGRILSSSDGTVSSLVDGASEPGLWDVEIKSSLYLFRYKELRQLNPALRAGYAIRAGEWVGDAGTTANGFHWEFVSVSMYLDRLCPMTYFDPASRAMVEQIWAQTPMDKIKMQFPDICSGAYEGKTE